MQYPTIAQPQYGFAPTMPMMPSMSDMPPAMMAEGGLVAAAKNVQSRGRNGDSMLVHMTPGEVGGLQALAMQQGGSLTINPQTGLPEANFLKNMLPTLLGFGLNFMFPGSGALIGLGVGGLETVRTGDIGKGLLAGLGAYGGANLAGSLTAAGAQQGVQAAGAAGQDLMNQAVTAPASAIAETGAGAGLIPPSAPATTIRDIYQAGGARDALLARGAETLPASVQALSAPTAAAPSFSANAAQAGQGFQNLFASGATGEGARAAALGNLGGYSGLAADVGMAAAPALLAQPEFSVPGSSTEPSNYEGPYTPSDRRVSYPDDERRRRSSEFTFFTPSNPVPFERGGSVPQLENGGFVLTKKAVDGLGKGSNKKGQKVASRGLGAIPIKGPGTGTSDSIKTSIDGKRPALVSNGEAYVPKKQVAKHGGAKKFYALMKKAERRA